MVTERHHRAHTSRLHLRFLPMVAVVALLASVPAIAPAAAAPPPPRAADTLAAIPSTPAPAPDPVVVGDSSNPPPDPDERENTPSSPKESFDPARSVEVESETTETKKVFFNADGSHTAQLSTRPLRVRDATGAWADIDYSLVARPDGSLGPRSAPADAPTLASSATGDATVATAAGPIVLRHPGAGGAVASVDNATANYAGALDGGRDLSLAVIDGGIEETVTLAGPTASPSYVDTFVLPPGVSARQGQGAVEFVGPDEQMVARFGDGLAYDASLGRPGAHATAPVSIRLLDVAAGVASVEVGVDAAWLGAPGRAFPARIDPVLTKTTTAPTASFDTWVYSAEYADTSYANHAWLVVGSADGGVHVTRSLLRFDLAGVLPSDTGYRVTASNLSIYQWLSNGHLCAPTATNVRGLGAPPTAATTWNNQPGVDASGIVSSTSFNRDATNAACPDGREALDTTSLAGRWLSGEPNHGLRVEAASETDPYAYKGLYSGESGAFVTPTLSITYDRLPGASSALTPVNGAVVGSPNVTLTGSVATDVDGEAVQYWFAGTARADATTTPDSYTGAKVIESGWLTSPSYTVPVGALVDGNTYDWRVNTWDGVLGGPAGTYTTGAFSSFRLDIHKGTAVDTVGPVSVDLSAGNATVGHSSPALATAGGPVGVSYAYNSAAAPGYGLTGAYYADDGTHVIDDKTPVLTRRDPNVNFNWAERAPAPAVGPDDFMVRWSGKFSPPRAGITYTFYAAHDDGIRIRVGGTLVLDSWYDQSVNGPGCNPDTCGTKFLGSTAPVDIQIDYYDHTGPAFVTVGVQAAIGVNNTTVTTALLPQWLSSDPPALPAGWTFSPTGAAAHLGEGAATVTDAAGAAHRWGWTGSGFAPPPGETGVVAATGGAVTHHGGGLTSVFDSAGRLASSTTAADDGTAPTSVNYGWSGTPLRLRSVTDPVSGRALSIRYGGDAGCPGGAPAGFDATAPASMVCAVVYPDATQTKLWYVAKQLARIQDPGGAAGDVISDFAYSGGLLTKVRDPLAAEAVAAAVAPNDDTSRSLVVYDPSSSWVASVSLAAPSAGAPRPAHSYERPALTEARVRVAGLSEPLGYSRKVVFDAAGRALTDSDALGRTTTTTWEGDAGAGAVANQPSTVTDAAGRMSTLIYDHAGRATDSYGPAPTSCFTAAAPRLPNGTCAPVAHTATEYDATIAGLAATYWPNATRADKPALRQTAVGDAAGAMTATWAAPPPTLPATWSARFAGHITLGTESNLAVGGAGGAGDWGSADLWVDDVLVEPTDAIPAGVHRIEVDYDPGTSASIELGSRPAGGASFAAVANAELRPGYGLVTRTTVHDDGGATPAMVTDTAYGPSPDAATAAPTATIVDPGGAALVSSFAYEATGTNLHRRPLARTLPAGNASTYAYYGDTQTVAGNPCVANNVSQAGLRRFSTDADPDGTGPQVAKVTESVYDAWGRPAGGRVGAEAWSCVVRDGRGRVTSATVAGPPARTVGYNYAVANNPLVASVSDAAGTITTTTDVLGRIKAYTDATAHTTTTTYDQAGRMTDTNGPGGAVHVSADVVGRPVTQSLDGKVEATATYAGPGGELSSVAYGNGTALASIGRDQAGRTTALSYTQSLGRGSLVSDSVGRSQSGRVRDELIDGTDANPVAGDAGANFRYDGAGRLTEASVPGQRLTYGFADSGGCGSLTTAGRNSNRTSTTTNGGAPTSYCYDAADRLTSSSDATVGTPVYDGHGNTTTLGTQALGYDPADRHMSTNAGTTALAYTRDATDRIISRTENAVATGYGFAGPGDSPAFTTGLLGIVVDRFVALVGGVSITSRASSADVWSYPNIHGDVVATADAFGLKQGPTLSYDPYGTALAAPPDNSSANFDFGWLGQHQRGLEHAAGVTPTIEMGARPYVPSIGRFLETDPVQGGSANDYDYCSGDPVNCTDLAGLKAQHFNHYGNSHIREISRRARWSLKPGTRESRDDPSFSPMSSSFPIFWPDSGLGATGRVNRVVTIERTEVGIIQDGSGWDLYYERSILIELHESVLYNCSFDISTYGDVGCSFMSEPILEESHLYVTKFRHTDERRV